jgi:hypothetical protein
MRDIVLPRDLPDGRAAWDAARALADQAAVAHPTAVGVRVKVHRNRRTLISWRHTAGWYELRVHYAFLDHPADVLAVATQRDAGAWHRLRALPREGREVQLQAAGHVHDLDALYAIEAARIPYPEPVTLRWGRWPNTPPRGSLRLGSCQGGPPATIRIHPVLDHSDVPDWFVSFVVYHELLHLRHPPMQQGSRRLVHPRSFRQAERRHPRYDEATVWEKQAIHGLLLRARRFVAARRSQ